MSLERFLIDLIVILIVAKLGGELAERFKQPAVLGELAAGILLGSSVLGTFGHQIPFLAEITVAASQPVYPILSIVAQIGVVLLLFEAGLESDMDELFRLGRPALWVAFAGVIFSFLAGYVVMRALGFDLMPALFVGAVLTATSVGISARSFSDLHQSQTKEAKIVLGAAVADDVIGLIILAVMSGIATKSVSLGLVTKTTAIALVFLIGAIVLGRWLAPVILKIVSRMKTRAALSTAALVFCFLLAVLASQAAGLSPIVGAFAAGLILAKTEHRLHIEERIKPVADLFIPVFFVLTGAAMPLNQINPMTEDGRMVLVQTLVLFVVAVIAKVLAGVSVPSARTNRWAIGIGMVPRGEVGLIFAGYGIQSGAIHGGIYSAILLVVMLTTFVTPPLLKIALTKGDIRKGGLSAHEAASHAVPVS